MILLVPLVGYRHVDIQGSWDAGAPNLPPGLYTYTYTRNPAVSLGRIT